MADCGICLEVLQSPVSAPCGHVHCERCLRSHINSGTDALKSACPTCRKPFHIVLPDFTFVPSKYHDFILPSMRKVYMDIPSIKAMATKIDALTQRLELFTKENEHLRQRCADYKHELENTVSERQIVIEQEEEAREEVANLRKKYQSLKRKYLEAQSYDHTCDTCDVMLSQGLSRRSSQSLETSREILPKVEEYPVSLEDLHPNSHRPKRSLPRSRLSSGMRHRDETESQSSKRQRTHQYSEVVVKGEEDEDE